MNLKQASHWRDRAGWVGAAFCLLALLALIDGLVGRWRETDRVIKLLPGWTAEINGPLLEEVKDPRELTYLSDTNHLKLAFAAVHRGYFWGGYLWRGQITAGFQIQPGEYHLTVVPRRSTARQATPAFRVVVFADALSLQRSAQSAIRRHTGFSPWGLAAVCLPGILLSFGAVFYLSLKLDLLLARQGQAEIYRVIRRDGGYEVHFGLGTTHGVQPGLELRVYNQQGQAVGLARVEHCAPKDAIALVTADQEVRPGFLVSWEI